MLNPALQNTKVARVLDVDPALQNTKIARVLDVDPKSYLS